MLKHSSFTVDSIRRKFQKSNFRQYRQSEKQRWEESEKRREEKRRSDKRKSQKKEDPGARKGRKVAKHCVFPTICGGGSKSRLAKAAGAEPAGQMRDEKLHAVVARSTCRSQNVQSTQHTRFGALLEVEMSKKCTSLWREAHFQVKMYKAHHSQTTFWKLTCRKSARRCGAKHISKPKVPKNRVWSTFGRSDVVSRRRRKGLCTWSKVSKT